jgi:AcrR family transcriptional regulator
MYRFSQAIYRELGPHVIDDGDGLARRRALLTACEDAFARLARDRADSADPARSLFRDVRMHFPPTFQPRVYEVVQHHIGLATQHIDHELGSGRPPEGDAVQCPPTARGGTPWQREPVGASRNGLSDRLLEEDRDSGIGLDTRQRERLRTAVATALAGRGGDDITVADIAERADLPAAALHARFSTAAECFTAVYIDALENMVSLVERQSTSGGTFRERFRNGLDALLRFCEREPEVARMCLVDSRAAGPPGLARQVEAISRIARRVQPVPGDEGTPTLASIMLVGAVRQVVGARVAAGETGSFKLLSRQLEQALVPYIDALAPDRQALSIAGRAPGMTASGSSGR